MVVTDRQVSGEAANRVGDALRCVEAPVQAAKLEELWLLCCYGGGGAPQGGRGGLQTGRPAQHHNQRLLDPGSVEGGVFEGVESIASDGDTIGRVVVEIFRKSVLVGCDVGRFLQLQCGCRVPALRWRI